MLSQDALIFGVAYLNGPRAKLSFGGDGAKMRITPRARDALNELLASGYAAPFSGDDQVKGREHYQGVSASPHLGALCLAAKINPLEMSGWPSFVEIDAPQQKQSAPRISPDPRTD